MPSTKVQSYEPHSPPTQSIYQQNNTPTAVLVDDQDFLPQQQQQAHYEAYRPTAVVVPSPQPTTVVTTAFLERPRYAPIGTRKPVQLTFCPNCAKQHVGTHTKTKSTGTTWACVLVGVVVFWPLCWVPLVADPLKQTNHYCKNCGVKVGRVKPFQ